MVDVAKLVLERKQGKQMADKVNITDVKFLVSWIANRLKGNSDAENCKRGKTCRTLQLI